MGRGTRYPEQPKKNREGCSVYVHFFFLPYKFDFTVDEGKQWLNPSRDKDKGTHRRRKVDEKSCVTFLLCDPGRYVQRSYVQNKWEETHTHKTQTNTFILIAIYCTLKVVTRAFCQLNLLISVSFLPTCS